MAIITLTSDWGLKDHYIGVVKGAILNKMPSVNIIDITHNIASFEIEQAAFVIRNCYRYYPKGTVHILAINTEESEIHPHTVIENEGQYFIGTDNGIFSMIFDNKPDKIFELTIPQESDFYTFSTRDRFVKAAVHLASGKKVEDLGTKKDDLLQKILLHPVIDNNLLKGHIIHIDNYQNLITNIKKTLFDEVGKERNFGIFFRTYEIKKISQSYLDVPIGEILALFGSNEHLEIAINQGNASGLLGLNTKDPIRIEFFD